MSDTSVVAGAQPSFFHETSMPLYSEFIYLSRYARWLPEKKRRETWPETVNRYITFFKSRVKLSDTVWEKLESDILSLRVMPSMRALMTAGPALARDELSQFNCAFLTIDHPRAFDELMLLLMCGVGVGFSIERQYVSKLPDVSETFHDTDTVIVVADSKIGWASAFKQLISLLYSGLTPKWDLSRLRPAGAPLKTFGGRSSGPDPLDRLFKFAVSLFKKAAGRKLSSVECHDLCCMVASIVVAGGVRRSALISLSNVSDDRMRLAKSGQWWVENPQRQLANNSAAFNEKPEFQVFLKEWMSLYESKSGERGIYNRVAATKQVVKYGRRNPDYDHGVNPCNEVILRPSGLCNLTEVVVRQSDTLDTLMDKVTTATILGTIQSTLTNFRYVRPVWKKNAEEERLLGVSLTGVMDHPVMGDPDSSGLPVWLSSLREHAVSVNKKYAELLGIQQSVSLSLVKPSGTVSQLVDSSSGIHPRFAKYYMRRVRCDKKDPIAQLMKLWGFPCEDDVTNKDVYVFSFPMKAPSTSKTVKDVGAMHQLKLWKMYQDHWCEHKPSMTVYYKDSEFLEIGNWIWNNFDDISGISFLPYSDHVYRQAPYEEINGQQYEEMLKLIKDIKMDWSHLADFEDRDNTAGSQTLACSAGACEAVDLVTM